MTCFAYGAGIYLQGQNMCTARGARLPTHAVKGIAKAILSRATNVIAA